MLQCSYHSTWVMRHVLCSGKDGFANQSVITSVTGNKAGCFDEHTTISPGLATCSGSAKTAWKIFMWAIIESVRQWLTLQDWLSRCPDRVHMHYSPVITDSVLYYDNILQVHFHHYPVDVYSSKYLFANNSITIVGLCKAVYLAHLNNV